MGSPQRAGRRFDPRWAHAISAFSSLVAAAGMYGVDEQSGRSWWTSPGHGFLLLALSNALGWWGPSVPPSGKRHAIMASQLVLGLAAIAWLVACLRELNG
jgi:hypothetical protein